jgi:hypothetical protein
VKILENKSKRIFATVYIGLLVGGLTLGFSAIPRTTHAANSSVGIVIPLYTYPTDGTWNAVIQAKQAYPNVPFIAVINPNSGPGSSQDSNYVQGIKNLQVAGIIVLGYVDTAYGGDSISSVEANVNLYNTWYGVNGIMFDDMTNQPGYESYYSTLSNYVHSLIPGSLTVGNPGTSVPTSYIGTLDVLCVYESTGYPSISFITYPGYSPSNFATVVIDAPLDTSFLDSLSGVVSWVYVTNANLPNPYDVLPSYFTTEVATLSTLDLTTTTSTTTTTTSTSATSTSTGSSATTTVNSADLSGNPISGMWTTWNQNGAVLATGYTPMTFTGNIGGTYLLTVADYQSTVFCHWQDGSTDSSKSLTLSGSVAETAYYSTNGSCPASTPTYPVTFTESGLVSGTSWGVTFNGVAASSTSNSITFSGIATGSYSWSTGPASCGTGCRFAPSPSSGTMSVTASTSLSISFTEQYQASLASSPGSGGVTIPPAGSSTWINAGASLSISATPSSGYTFASWTSSTSSIAIASAGAASTTATINGPGTLTAKFSGNSATVTVKSDTLSGKSFSGMWTTWSQGGVQLATSYTPISFTGAIGQNYVVAVANYGSTVFCHWQDGSTNPQRQVSLGGNVALTAYYSTTGSCQSKTVKVTVISKSVSGVQFTGMWLEVTANGNTVASGYTTLTFVATVGVAYTVSMSNWNNYVFAYWSNGSTNPVRTITPAQATTLTACYNTGGLF